MFKKGDIVVWKSNPEEPFWEDWVGHRAEVIGNHDDFLVVKWLDGDCDEHPDRIEDGWYYWRFEEAKVVVSRSELEEAYSVD